MLSEVIIIFTLLFLIYFKNRAKLPKNLPPGPLRLPGIGCLIQLAASKKKAPYDVFHELSQKYGPIMFIQLGVTYQVVLEDYDIIKEVLTDDVWVDRYYNEWMARRSFGKILGVLMISGDTWKEMRRFSVRTLRDFGFGKQKSMEMSLEEEVVELQQNLERQLEIQPGGVSSGVVYMKQFFTISVLNVLWNMIAGFRFCHDDARLRELLIVIENEVRTNAIGSLDSPLYLYAAFPFLAKILPAISASMSGSIQNVSAIHNFFQEILTERRAEGFYREEQRDYIDVFLNCIDAHKNDPPEKNLYTDEQFVVVTMDLFMAGSETTSNTIEFAILFFIKYPDVQAKVQAEIDAVVGQNRFPCISDKPNMPYTEATILEIQRHANVVPFSIRSPTRDTTLRGYAIPANTAGVINLHAMHMDKKKWGDPQNFRPERFLNDSSKIINADRILPFGAGKRVCLGEQLAKASIFIYMTAILQKFRFKESLQHPLPNTDEPASGFTLAPQPYYALVEQRFQK